MPDSPIDAVAEVNSALAIRVGSGGVLSRPLDVLGFLRPASRVRTPERERLFARLYLEAPLPYWALVNWARKLKPSDLPELFASTRSDGWSCVCRAELDPTAVGVQDVLQEVVARFGEFDPNHWRWRAIDGVELDDPAQRRKYVLGLDLARSYIRGLAGLGDDTSSRVTLLLDQQTAWREWVDANTAAGHSPEAVCEATALGMDHVVSRDVSSGVGGVGRTHVLLEEMSVTRNPAMGIVTASVFPIDTPHAHLDGLLIPDLREIGVLSMSADFLTGVRQSWDYVRSISPSVGPSLLCYSVRPSTSTVLQSLAGSSAEAATLAAIESAVAHRVLRSDAAASARLTLFTDGDAVGDPIVGPASFEEKKFFAAVRHRLRKIVVHKSVAEEWKRAEERVGIGPSDNDPDIIASEYYRRDIEGVLATRSQWRLAYRVPGAITLAFTAFAALVWQSYKLSMSPIDAVTADPVLHAPLVIPALVASEMASLALCAMILVNCQQSIRRSLDSRRASWLALAVCGTIVLAAQFVPIGVRYEGLLDNPCYSVLFGEPQVTARQVVQQGGAGLLLLHTVSQSVGFVTILFGVSAFTIRLLQTRAHSEPIYSDRCELIRNDWRFSAVLFGYFVAVVTIFCLPRNTLWYYYLATLPRIELIEDRGSFWTVVGPLVGVYLVLVLSVFCVWFGVLNEYLVRVVTSARGRAGYTAQDVVSSLPRLSRLIYYARPAE